MLSGRLRTIPRSLCAIALAAVAGCTSKVQYVLGSDIPAPSEVSGQATTGIERREGVLVGIETVFSDKVDDPSKTADRLVGEFARTGWSVERRGATPSTATVVFRKDDRRCRVHVVRNEVDPAMGRIGYVLHLADTKTVSADG